MADYGYSTPFQGYNQGLPQGYLEAATAPGRNIANGIASFGASIAAGIEKYRARKDEGDFAQQKIQDSIASALGAIQSGNIMDPNTHESQLMKTIMGITKTKDPEKLLEFAADTPSLALGKKKALAHDLEFALNRYDTNRNKQAMEDYHKAVTAQVQQEMDIKRGTIATDTAMAQVPVIGKKLVETYNPDKEVSVYEDGKLVAGPGDKLAGDTPWDVQMKEVSTQMPFSDYYRKYAETAAQNKAPVNYESALKSYQALGGRMPVAEGMVPTGATQAVPGGNIQYQNMDAEMEAMQRKYENDVKLAQIKNQPELDARTVFLPGGVKALAPNSTTADKLRENLSKVDSGMQALDKLIEFSGKWGRSVKPEMIAKISPEIRMLQGALRLEMVGPGALTEGDQKRLDAAVNDPTKLFSLGNSSVENFKSIKEILNRGLKAHLKANGINIEPQGSNQIDYTSDPRLKAR